MTTTTTGYTAQGQAFIDDHGLTFNVSKHPHQTAPTWDKGGRAFQAWNGREYVRVTHGTRYTVQITRSEAIGARPTTYEFDFWGSINDRIQDIQRPGHQRNPLNPYRPTRKRSSLPTAYDVLSCLDPYTTDDVDEVVADYGPMPFAQAQAIVNEGRKLREFFTDDEQAALTEIQ